MDLHIWVTADNDPVLADRTYTNVAGLRSGPVEMITASGVSSAFGRVDNDTHDFLSEGFYSLHFDPVAATAVAIRFERDSGDPAPWTHYKVFEIEITLPEPSFGLLLGMGVVFLIAACSLRRREGQGA